MSEKKKIIVVSTDFGTEESEITVPVEKLKQLGHDVTVATPSGDDVQTMVGDKDLGKVVPADSKLSDVTGEFDVVVLPGGTLNADAARIDEGVRALVKKQADAGKVVAAICHAPWVLVDAGVAQGKTVTGYVSVRTDLANAGAIIVDQPVKVCGANNWTLITSRTPDDLDEFVKAIDEA